MKHTKLAALCAGILLTTAGCGALDSGNGGSTGLSWRPFTDVNNSVQEVTFWRRANSNAQVQKGDVLGSAQIRAKGENNTRRPLGPVVLSGILPQGEPVTSIFVNADSAKAVTAPAELAAAKNAAVYSMGAGIFEEIRFSAPAGLCSALKQGGRVSVQSATNYYYDDSKTHYFTSFIDSTITAAGVNISQTRQSFIQAGTMSEQERAAMVQGLMNQGNRQDANKQARILLSEICGLPIPDEVKPK